MVTTEYCMHVAIAQSFDRGNFDEWSTNAQNLNEQNLCELILGFVGETLRGRLAG